MTVYRIIVDTFDTTATMEDIMKNLKDKFYYINYNKRLRCIMELDDIEQ